MKKFGKRIFAGALLGVFCMTAFAGCAKSIDGTQTAATAQGEEISLGMVSLLARYQQVKIGGFYGSMMGDTSGSFWDNIEDEETGETYGDSVVKDSVEQIQKMCVLRQKAQEMEISLSEKDRQKITEATQAFMDGNDQEVLKKIGVSKEDVEGYLELSAYQEKMREEIIKDVDTEVSDEEAQQTTITYTKVSYDADADDGVKAEKKELAQEILDEVLATAEADMESIAKELDEESVTSNVHYSANDEEDDTVEQALKDGVADLKDSEVNSSLIEGEDGYYIVRLEQRFDEEATEREKETILGEREDELFSSTTQEWYDAADLQMNEKVLAGIEITSKDAYVQKQTEVAEEEAETEEEVETEEEAETEEGAEDTAE